MRKGAEKMLENLYTTKMSANKKTLQSRFTKIRSKSGRISKIAAAVMSCAVAVTMLSATVVMAAVGSDGLEHFTKNEIYYKDGVRFSVNVSGKNVPAWVYEDVAGEDGKIDVTVNRYQTRSIKGAVEDDEIVELSGSKGTIKLASNGKMSASKNGFEVDAQIKAYKYRSQINFVEFNNDGYSPKSMPIMSLIHNKDKKYRRVEVCFTFNDKKEVQTAFVGMINADEYDNPMSERFDTVRADAALLYIGDFEESYTRYVFNGLPGNYYFSMYEDGYENKKTEGIDFEIAKATTDAIIVSADITLPQVGWVEINVYDKDGRNVAYNEEQQDGTSPQYGLRPIRLKGYGVTLTSDSGGNSTLTAPYKTADVPENQFVSGEKYRVCIAVLDKEYNLIYRWQKYITMQ